MLAQIPMTEDHTQSMGGHKGVRYDLAAGTRVGVNFFSHAC